MRDDGPYIQAGLPGGRGTSSPIRRRPAAEPSGVERAGLQQHVPPLMVSLNPGVSRVDHLTPPILHVEQLTLPPGGFLIRQPGSLRETVLRWDTTVSDVCATHSVCHCCSRPVQSAGGGRRPTASLRVPLSMQTGRRLSLPAAPRQRGDLRRSGPAAEGWQSTPCFRRAARRYQDLPCPASPGPRN